MMFLFSLLKDLINFAMVWSFLYVCAIFILILGIYSLKTNEPEIQTRYIYKEVRPFVYKREICNRISGCRITEEGECIGCTVKESE
tara:strand:- start:174 stop:431 length:258 start_codon:yes stop_codon:yes gene_type:complete